MKKLVLFLVLVGAAACAAHAATTPPAASDSSWIWQIDGGYEYYTPGRGYTWQVAQPVVPAHHLMAAVPPSWQWVSPVIDADHGSLATGTGYLYDIHCILTAANDAGQTPLYIMGFDSSASTQPSGGTAPLFGITSGGMSAVGNDVSYADEQYAHGVVVFNNGLLIALSTTADTFTAPAAGNQVRCDAKLSARR